MHQANEKIMQKYSDVLSQMEKSLNEWAFNAEIKTEPDIFESEKQAVHTEERQTELIDFKEDLILQNSSSLKRR